MSMLPGVPPAYIEQQAMDANGNPVTIAVRAPPPGTEAPPTDIPDYLAPPKPGAMPGFGPDTMKMLGFAPKGGASLRSLDLDAVKAGAPRMPPAPDSLAGAQARAELSMAGGPSGASSMGHPLSTVDTGAPTPRPAGDMSAPPAGPPPPTAFAQPPGTGGSGPPMAPPGGVGFAPPPGGAINLNGYGSAGDEKALKAAYVQQQTANQQAFEVGQKQASTEAGFAQEAARVAEEQRKQQQVFQAHWQDAMDAQMKSYTQAQDEVAKVNTTIDPNRFWATKSTGARIAAAIGAAMGAFGAAMTGGPNYAQQIIDKAVNDDIDAQKHMAEMQLKKGNEKVASQQTLYGMMRNRFGDDATALAATQAAALNVVTKKLEAAKAGLSSEDQKAKLSQLQATTQQQAANAMAGLHDKANDNARGWATLQVQQQHNQMEYDAKLASGRAAKAAKELPPEALDRLGGYEAAAQIFGNLQKSFETKTGPGSFLAKHVPSSDSAAYERERQAAAETAARAISGGRPTPGLMEAILEMMPSATTPTKAGKEQFRVLQKDNSLKRKSELQTYTNANYDTARFGASPVDQEEGLGFKPR